MRESQVRYNVLPSLRLFLTNRLDYHTQLEINIILNAWCLVVSLIGTYFVETWGRKPSAAVSTGALTIFLFMIGALTKSTP
jgi:hypothetical protein